MGSWIFQGNPAEFRINDAIRELDRITWLAKVNLDKMRPGDTVFIWKSIHNNEPAGIVAKAIMETTWMPISSPPDVFSYWVDSKKKNTKAKRVWLDIKEKQSEGHTMITRDMCLEDDILKEMLVIRQPNGTNYLLSDNEAEILESIWAET